MGLTVIFKILLRFKGDESKAVAFLKHKHLQHLNPVRQTENKCESPEVVVEKMNLQKLVQKQERIADRFVQASRLVKQQQKSSQTQTRITPTDANTETKIEDQVQSESNGSKEQIPIQQIR